MSGVIYQKQGGSWVPVLVPDAGEPPITPGTTGQYWRGDKSWQTLDKAAVALANVDNTSDANKPVSTAQQTALNLKADKSTTVTAGTGLTGGGDLSANPTLTVAYGTIAGTAAQGNDTRLSDSRTPTGTAGGDLTGTYPNPTIAGLAVTDAKVATANKDGVAGTASMRTLGTGAQQAAAGNHTHALSAITSVFDATVPAALGTAAVGTAATAARRDHVHAMPTAAQVGAAAASHTHATGDVTGLDAELNARPELIEYTTTVPARPTTSGKVIWQGQVDPAANALAGDSWWPTA